MDSTTLQTPNQTNINLAEIMDEMFRVLTTKEKEVIVKRFSLDNKPKLTLEKIGQKFSVTRERIRQIEKIALGKLKRTVQNTKLNVINEIASDVLENKHGGVLLESKLVSEILNRIYSTEDIDANIIKLALNINPDIVKAEKTNIWKPFWRLKDIDLREIQSVIEAGISFLNKKEEVMETENLATAIAEIMEEKGKKMSKEMIASSLEIDRRIKRVKEGFGLMTWRHINPRSIRDKAFIILKKADQPLHFVEIANRISEAGFDKKIVTTQAVHNELIRYEQFVLVGRGLYALREWGYRKGTVADVIEGLLKKKSPMTKQEIIAGVLKQRHVKKGTISLNLQKNPQFIRVGRAVYALDESKK